MNLDKVAVNIRPRTAWEAIDLGFLLARQWYKRLWLLWMLTASFGFTLAVVAGLALPGSGTKWALLLFWFFKPFYEPCVLAWAAKALFDEQCSTRETFLEVRKNVSLQWIFTILLSRFSFFRSFSLPVVQLEKLEGKKKKQRLALLQNASEIAVLLTVAGFFLEITLTFSFLIILFILIPDKLRWIDFGHFVFLPGKWFLLFSYLASCSIIAPLYVCSGFMMYISRRVRLEAWDIEIGFKQLSQRLIRQKKGILGAVVLLLICFSIVSASGIAHANEPDPQTAKTVIGKILQQKDFGRKITVYRWVPIKKDAPPTQSSWRQFWIEFFNFLQKISKYIAPILAKYGEFLIWICVGCLMGFVLLKYAKLRQWLDLKFAGSANNHVAPEILFGLDLRPQSLPKQIDAVCLQLLEEGKKREAMSLLYRGTLSTLINRWHLAIHPSFTENECCTEVGRNRPNAESVFFNDLTSIWVFLAFGHRDPELQACRSLVSRWATLYGGQL